ncbi:MAG TPA: thiamine pyrophosphate-binding protein [Stellaceae bacterium]|nr:thiamine pyrophosphate-binding protein [Stellaceae bacterium]
MASNADLIVSQLKAAGISPGFGIPSGNVLPLMEAMRAGGMRFVLTAHEGSAAFAADVTGRMTGRPGLCIATHGPGATNLSTGIGCAFLDRSPMIAITCNVPVAQHGRRVQMHIDHHALMRPITKATLPLRSGTIAATVSDAIALALAEPQGPVHLDLPEDVALASATEAPCAIPEPAPLAGPSENAVRTAREIIARARKPVAVIGAGARTLNGSDALRRFVEHHRMPFATTAMAKGMIDDDHPLSLGCIERARRQVQRAFLKRADLIVGIGYDTAEVEYEAWIGDRPLLHVAIERADTDGTVAIAGDVIGRLDHSLAALDGESTNDWHDDEISAHRAAFQASLRPPTNRFAPHQAIDVVRRVLPREGILAFDVGAHTHQIASQWLAHAAGTFLLTNNWSSMGFGLPAAIAAKLARPDLPVVAIIGDGCFQMTCGEVAVARRLGLVLPIVVLDDNWLALIKVKQERRAYPYVGTALDPSPPPAHYFGVPAVAASNAAALEDALRAALRANGPTVIEAMVDAAHYSETVYD